MAKAGPLSNPSVFELSVAQPGSDELVCCLQRGLFTQVLHQEATCNAAAYTVQLF